MPPEGSGWSSSGNADGSAPSFLLRLLSAIIATWLAVISLDSDVLQVAAQSNDAADNAVASRAADHWSFGPLSRPRPPPGEDPWITGPVDAFILAKLKSAGLEPSPPARPVHLVRRLHLDMLGLPPEPYEIEAFARDPRPAAYERLVDRVLASSRYGERWAQHWLDVVRFAETNGFEENRPRPSAYHYRDYVIEAFNNDKPYDRFIVEQLAGDAVGVDVATAFLVGGACDPSRSPDINLVLMQRQDELEDVINTTGTALLGLTLGCARCHDHKFDPVPQKEYYALQAVFAGVRHGEKELQGPESDGLKRRIGALQERAGVIERELSESGAAPLNPVRNVERFPPIEAKVVRFTIFSTSLGKEPCIDELEVYSVALEDSSAENVALARAGAKASSSGNLPGDSRHRLEHINDGRAGHAWSWIADTKGEGWVEIELARPVMIDRMVWGRDRDLLYKDRVATAYRIEVSGAAGRWRLVASSEDHLRLEGDGTHSAAPVPATSAVASVGGRLSPEREERLRKLVLEKRQWEGELASLSSGLKVYAGRFEEPEPTHLLYRGDPKAPREVVLPGAISVLGRLEFQASVPEKVRRLALAQWIARRPLAARVAVNRIWHYHFGTGIVGTPSDFGANGSRPTHPELLDWLAAELVRSGWSLKHIHRLILLSSTYRQSSLPEARGLAVDAESRLLWRFPPRRLEGESIRDSILATSGALNLQMGGAGFDLLKLNKTYRRWTYDPQDRFGPAEWRRMIYGTKIRMEQDAVFGAFDCPDGGQVCSQRNRSTTAFQALNLFNSDFVLEQATLFARRLEQEVGASPGEQIERAFTLAFGREPQADERAEAIKLVEAQGLATLCRAIFNANEFLFVP
jgi:hypothetical protein